MGSSKNHMPDFRQQAKDKIKSFTDSAKSSIEGIINGGVPDFAKIAEEKMNSILPKIKTEEDAGKLTESLLEKLENKNTGKSIGKVAKALGIDIDEDAINRVIDKKNELYSAAESGAIGAVTNFMSKEGYKVDSPDKVIMKASNAIQNDKDPTGVFKEAVKPFSELAKDTFNGNHSVSLKNIGSSIGESFKKSEITDAASDLSGGIKDVYRSIVGNKENPIDIPDISEKISFLKENTQEIKDTVQATKDKYTVNSKIDSEIPDHIKKLIEKYTILGGN